MKHPLPLSRYALRTVLALLLTVGVLAMYYAAVRWGWPQRRGAALVADAAALIAIALGVLPLIHYLVFGLPERRETILGYFDTTSIKAYFEQFFFGGFESVKSDPEKALRNLYHQRFGFRTFLMPGILYLATLVLAVWLIAATSFDEAFRWVGPKVDNRGVFALAGAYLWVVWDVISRSQQRDIVPSMLYWYAFRFVISLPLGYALSFLLNQEMAPAVTFTLGAFPTNTLMLIVRRQGAQKLGLGEEAASSKLELETLQGINTTLAEKFGEIGVTTILQLAYEDPIQLTMRTNLSFVFITDVMSQAMAVVYGFDLNITRPLSIRGGIEAAEIYEELTSHDKVERERAKGVVKKLATTLGQPAPVIEKVLESIRNDPFTQILRNIWA